MNKIVKQAKAGALWQGKGYLTIGLENIDVKIVKNEIKDEKSPKYKLVQAKGLKDKFLTNLFEHSTNDNKSYFSGSIELGFGVMEIKIFKIDDSKRKDKEKSPTSIIFGRLIMENIKESYQEDDVTNYKQDDSDFEHYVNTEEKPF